MMMNCMRNGDFREGIRAVLVDRDNAPQWMPKQLESVTTEQINAYFEPLGEYDLDVFAQIGENGGSCSSNISSSISSGASSGVVAAAASASS